MERKGNPMYAPFQKIRAMRMILTTCLVAALACAALIAFPAQALATDDEPPSAPKTVKATATKQCTVKLRWSKVPNAIGYMIYWSENRNKGYKAVDYVPFYRSSFTHTEAIAGAKNYYKIRAIGPSGNDGPFSKVVGVKVNSAFKNSFVKFTLPRYWRGKVCISEKKYSAQYKSVYIRDAKTGGALAQINWSKRYNEDGGDIATHWVKRLRRGKGSVELWVNSWATNLYFSKYVSRDGNPSVNSDDYSSARKLTTAETNRLIKLQTGGKFSYKKVKKVPESKIGKYSNIANKYIAKNLKIKVVK